MKKIATFLVIASLTWTAFGQVIFPGHQAGSHHINTNFQGANKIQVTDYRLIGFSVEDYDLGVYTATDSLSYLYGPSSENGHNDFDFYYFTNYYQAPWMANAMYSIYDGVDWLDYVFFYNSFNIEGVRDRLDLQVWDGDSFEPVTRIEYTFTLDGEVETETILSYSGGYDNEYRYTYTYDAGRLANILEEDWDGLDWVNENLTVYTYDGSGLLDFINYSNWGGAAWEDSYRDIYTFNAEGQVTEILGQDYSLGWIDDSRATYSYDGGGFNNELLIEDWDGANWIDDSKLELTEYMEGLIDVSSAYYFDGVVWEPIGRYNFTYESYDNGIVSVDDPTVLDLAIFPNPASDQLQISAPWEGSGIITLYTIDGKKVLERNYNTVLESNIVLDVHTLEPGNYLVQLHSGQQTAIAKFVVD